MLGHLQLSNAGLALHACESTPQCGGRGSHAPPPTSLCQEANYVTKNEMSGEAHVHALANLKERTIIVMQPGAEKVMLMKYSPGWKAQDDITRQEMLALCIIRAAKSSATGLRPH